MSQERLNDELAAIEAALCSLTPTASGIDRDRLMFLAGKAAASRRSSRRWFATVLWPTAMAASLLAATTFAILWATGDGRKPVERITEVAAVELPTIVDSPADTLPPSPWENRRLYRLVLEKGMEALPESSGHFVPGARSAPHEETYRSLLKQFLDDPTG